jgi:ribosomal protein L7Ae-like RNA K-turn-binding protein
LAERAFNLLSRVKSSNGKIRRGLHETTRALKNGDAKLVYIVTDLDVPQQVFHLKLLCERNNVPYVCIPEHREHGILDSAVIIDIGKARSMYYGLRRDLLK